MQEAQKKPDYILTWVDPETGEPGTLPFFNTWDICIPLTYRDRYKERGMKDVELYSEWNKGPVKETRVTALPVKN